MEAAFVIPVFNQVDYTVRCLDSLNADGIPDSDIVVVDNGSSDGTAARLRARPALRVISNETNRGCSFAWNQGVQAATGEWVVVLNNDVVVAPGFLRGLLAFAEREKCDIVSPAKSEGELDYPFSEFAQAFLQKMGAARRLDFAHGVAFMVHRRVFDAIGLFDTKLGQAGYEDEDFFRRARRAGFRLGMTGGAFLHHFGSITQKSVKARMREGGSLRLGDRDYFRKKHGLNWLVRRKDLFQRRLRLWTWRFRERRRFGLTLNMHRISGAWCFR